jgi:hypothetical protein
MRLLLVLAATAAVAILATSSAHAATQEISVVGCYFNHGGTMTVPAGTDVVFRVGWADKTSGYVRQFLRSQRTTATLNGSPVGNASGRWGPIEKMDRHSYLTFWRLDGGTLANPGDSTKVQMQVTLSRPVTGIDPNTNKPARFPKGPIFPGDFGCTVTAT